VGRQTGQAVEQLARPGRAGLLQQRQKGLVPFRSFLRVGVDGVKEFGGEGGWGVHGGTL